MKILITGSYCSGKTTLAGQLHSVLPDSILSGEVTREVLKLFGKVDWSIPELRAYILIRQLMEEKIASASSVSDVIVDAGIISIIAHDRILSKSVPDRLELLKYFKHTAYDVVLFCDHQEIPIVDDGERYTDQELRSVLASVVEETLHSLKIRDYVVVRGTRTERLKLAMEALTQKALNHGQSKR
jgi:nicotinamide riboside kinase